METITKEKQTHEEILLHFIQDFFDCRKLPQHLIFIEHWMEKILFNHPYKKRLQVSDLLFFSAKFSRLLTACYEIQYTSPKNAIYFEEAIKIPKDFIPKEQKLLVFYPNYLKAKEICNPLLVFQSLFKNHSVDYYKDTLQSWVNESLSIDDEPENLKLIFPTYKNLKRMIEACWLIHERAVSKNSYQSQYATPSTHSEFSLSCPLLLHGEYLNNPYLLIESFFSFADINEYRSDLTQWFKAALNEQQNYENANDLLFIHNQFTQLIHAGYLIGISQPVYEPIINYSKEHTTFGQWLLARAEIPYTIQILSPYYKENPMKYCSENLTLNHVIKLRYGLKEWLEAALSKNSSITSLDHPYIFDQYEDLQKILEALFLLVVQPTLAD